jgi:hypothetical protein
MYFRMFRWYKIKFPNNILLNGILKDWRRRQSKFHRTSITLMVPWLGEFLPLVFAFESFSENNGKSLHNLVKWWYILGIFFKKYSVYPAQQIHRSKRWESLIYLHVPTVTKWGLYLYTYACVHIPMWYFLRNTVNFFQLFGENVFYKWGKWKFEQATHLQYYKTHSPVNSCAEK